jgi:hypothetical protein
MASSKMRDASSSARGWSPEWLLKNAGRLGFVALLAVVLGEGGADVLPPPKHVERKGWLGAVIG